MDKATDEIVRLLLNAEFLVEEGDYALAAEMAAQANERLLEIVEEGEQ